MSCSNLSSTPTQPSSSRYLPLRDVSFRDALSWFEGIIVDVFVPDSMTETFRFYFIFFFFVFCFCFCACAGDTDPQPSQWLLPALHWHKAATSELHHEHRSQGSMHLSHVVVVMFTVVASVLGVVWSYLTLDASCAWQESRSDLRSTLVCNSSFAWRFTSWLCLLLNPLSHLFGF